MLKLIISLFLFSLPCYSNVLIEKMTLEEKVGQLLFVCFKGEEVNDAAVTLVQKLHVGGIIYYNWANGLNSKEQVIALSHGLQTLAQNNRLPIPLTICADQEGGLVTRLKSGCTLFPGNLALGMAGKEDLAEEAAYITGQELLFHGVTLNLAPVVDVNNNPRNPIIGIRSFSEDPQVVTAFSKQALAGYKRSGIASCIKHFPGHGDVESDSHHALPVIFKTKEELKKIELLPFTQLASETDAVMTAHILLPHLDPLKCATLSKPVLDLLRKEIGFEGVIIADSLTMKGVWQDGVLLEDLAIESFNAGCDVLLFGGRELIGTSTQAEISVADVEKIQQALISAVQTKSISEERLNASVSRILQLKNKSKLELQLKPGSPQGREVAEKIASLACKVTLHHPIKKEMKQTEVTLIAPKILEETLMTSSFAHLGKSQKRFFFSQLNPSVEETEQIKDFSTESGILLFFAYNDETSPTQQKLIQELCKKNKNLIILSLRNPSLPAQYPEAACLINSFSPSLPSLEAAYKLIHLKVIE